MLALCKSHRESLALTRRGFFVSGAAMKPQPKIKDERKLMRDLMRQRERSSEHRSPDWLAAFWRRVAT
jgi:hypothetical protein